MSKQTFITSRDDKGRHAVNLFAIEYDKARLDSERAHRLNERSGELQEGIAKIIAKLSAPEQYANEAVQSNYTYPKEYAGPKPIADQVNAVANIFGLDPKQALEYAKNLPDLPNSAEGWFAIPVVNALARKHFPKVTKPAEKNCRAVQLVLAKIAKSRQFCNWREDEIMPSHFRVHDHTTRALKSIALNQPGDILIVACQLGILRRGESTILTRDTFASNEFGLSSLAVGSIILVHPERLIRWDELHMYCPGDEFNPGTGYDFHVPCFLCRDDEIGFLTVCGHPHDHYGSASGFVPQY